MKLQTGVVRTNCMDNLDRTNVAQAAIAKWTLERQLKELRVIQENDSVDNYEDLIRDFRESAYPVETPAGCAIDRRCVADDSVVGSRELHLNSVFWYWCPQDGLHPHGQANP